MRLEQADDLVAKREVRAAPDQAQEIVVMRLDPAGAAVAARRRR